MTREQLREFEKDLVKTGLENVQNIVLIKNGATNGDVIKVLYPNVDIEIHNITVYVIFDMYSNVISFDLDWWNSPYKR
jgi:hypothetical protein